MQKKLYMGEPLITSYPTIANSLAAVGQYPRALEWYYENFIQLFSIPVNANSYINFFAPFAWKSCPWFEYWLIPQDLFDLQSENDKLKFLMDCIKREYYVTMYCDQFYIEASWCFNANHKKHDTFIFGYDKEKELFNIVDFYGKYVQSVVSFNTMKTLLSNKGSDWRPDDFDGILLYIEKKK